MSGSVVERIRDTIGEGKFNCYLSVYIDDLRVLLAAVEAARDVVDDPKSGVPGIMATLRLSELREALDALYATAPEGDG